MPPALRIVSTASATALALAGREAGEAVSEAPELFPFWGNGKDDLTAPGDWPFDRQCILRLPNDIAKRLAECLRQHVHDHPQKGLASTSQLDLHLRPNSAVRNKSATRHWEVKVFGETLKATLVDLPCRVESHLLPKPQGPMSEDCPGRVAYKSADIEHMLLVHRGPEPEDVFKDLNQRTYEFSSGITPPTQRIRQRKFRSRPPRESEFAAEHVPEAVTAIQERIANAPYIYEECTEVDEAFYLEILRTQPENIWRPTPALRTASRDLTSGAPYGCEATSRSHTSGPAPLSGAQHGRGKAASSIISTSSGGSAGGSAIAAMTGSRKRAVGSTVSESAASGGPSVADGASSTGAGTTRRRFIIS